MAVFGFAVPFGFVTVLEGVFTEGTFLAGAVCAESVPKLKIRRLRILKIVLYIILDLKKI